MGRRSSASTWVGPTSTSTRRITSATPIRPSTRSARSTPIRRCCTSGTTSSGWSSVPARPVLASRLLPRFGVAAALVALTVAAGYVRLAGLPSVEGGMGRDSTRLALAARGILEHGLPLLPGGLVYTRGLLPAYLEAAAFALVGPSDQAARLPSLLEGALLVPAVYALARGLGGPGVALAAAALVAFSPQLVVKSREAWLYPSFLLWFVLALAWLQRARQGRLTDRVLAGMAVAAALL